METREQKEIEYWEKRSAMVAIQNLDFKFKELKAGGMIIPDIVFDTLQKELDKIEF